MLRPSIVWDKNVNSVTQTSTSIWAYRKIQSPNTRILKGLFNKVKDALTKKKLKEKKNRVNLT